MLGIRSRSKPRSMNSEIQNSLRTMETSTRNESSDSMLGEKSRSKPRSFGRIQNSSITEDASTHNESPSISRGKVTKPSNDRYLEPLVESPDSSWGE